MPQLIENKINDLLEPFHQDTVFTWANVPFFPLFYTTPQSTSVYLGDNTNDETIKGLRDEFSDLNHIGLPCLKTEVSRQSIPREREAASTSEVGPEVLCVRSLHTPVDIVQNSKKGSGACKNRTKEENLEGTKASDSTRFGLELLSAPSFLDHPQWTGPYSTAKQPQVSFRTQLREVDRCFHAQMEVLRGIDATFQKLHTVEAQMCALRAEHRTTELVACLRQERNLSTSKLSGSFCLKKLPPKIPSSILLRSSADCRDSFSQKTALNFVSKSEEQASSVASNPIKNILDIFSKPSAVRTEKNQPLSPGKEYPRFANTEIEVVRSEKSPLPYKIIHWVPLNPHTLDESSKMQIKSELIDTEDRRTGINDYTVTKIKDSITMGGGAYTDDFEQIEEGNITSPVGTDGGLGNFTIPKYIGKTYMSISDSIIDNNSIGRSSRSLSNTRELSSSRQLSIPTPPPSDSTTSVLTSSALSVSDEVEGNEYASNADEKMADSHTSISSNEAQLFSKAFKEFYQACCNANFIVHGINASCFRTTGIVTGTNSILVDIPKQGEGSHASSDIVPDEWQDLFKNLIHVRKLQRFTQHLLSSLKTLDLHRRVQRQKQRLLIKAQRLSRMRKYLYKNPTIYFKDVMNYNMIGEDISEKNSAFEAVSQTEDEVEDTLHVSFFSNKDGSEISEVKSLLMNDQILSIDSNPTLHIEEEIFDELENLSNLHTGERKQKVQTGKFSYDEESWDEILEEGGAVGLELNESEKYVADRFSEAHSLSDVLDIIDLLPDDVVPTVTSASLQPPLQLLKRTISTDSFVYSAVDSTTEDADISSQYAVSSNSPAPIFDGPEGADVRTTDVTAEEESVDFGKKWLHTLRGRSKVLLCARAMPNLAQSCNSYTSLSRKSPDSNTAFVSLGKLTNIIPEVSHRTRHDIDRTEGMYGEVQAGEELSFSRDSQYLSQGHASDTEEKPCFSVEKILFQDINNNRNTCTSNCLFFPQNIQRIESDLATLNAWKEEQKSFVKQLLPNIGTKIENEVQEDGEGSENNEKSFAHHFEFLETLLETRFGCKQQAAYDCCSLCIL